MKNFCIFTSFFILIFIPLLLKGQENEVKQLTPVYYSNLQLPSLSTLFENAKNTAAVEYFNIRMKEQESLLKTEKRSWLKYFKATASYQYGKTGVLSYSENNINLYQYSDIEQSFYNVGGSILIPLDDILDRGNRIKRQKLEMEATKVEVERWHDEQKLRIIEAYTSAEQLLSVLKMKIEALSLSQAQFKLAQNDFINGKMNAQELNIQKGYEVTALDEYEATRAALNKALLQLEVLSNTKILNQ